MVGTFALARSRAAVLAGALVALLTATLVGAPPAAAEHYEDVREIEALEGIGASVAYSKLAFPDGATGVVLTRSNIFADSLASGLLQGSRPLLLTASHTLSPAVEAEIERLGARNVTILGGTSAISKSVEDDLREDGYRVNRLSGASRVETAVAVARSLPGSRIAILARAFGTEDPTSAFADALSAGAWSADRSWPVLLTETSTLSAPTAEYLRSGVDQVWVVGGQAAVSETVLSQVRALGVAATRVSGPNRFDTALAVARQRGFASGADADDIVLVDGQGANAWADGFAAAAFAAQNDAPVVLANSAATALPASTLAFLSQAPAAELLVGWTVPAEQADAAAEAMGKEPGVTRIMNVAMHGQNVVRPSANEQTPIWGYGEPGKTGMLTMTVDDQSDTIDYEYQSNAGGAYMAETSVSSGLMIRRGAVDKRGDWVVRFPSPPTGGSDSGTVDKGEFAPSFDVRELIDAPSGFYAESYTQHTYSQGAVRGQLPSGGTAHLPPTPTFTGIQTNEGDDRITLKFAAPVFLSGGSTLAAADFDIKVRSGVAVTYDRSDASTTASGAKDAIVVHLVNGSLAPTAGTQVSVTLKASGAAKLINNLGARVASADVTHTHTTPADTVAPKLSSIEAASNTNRVTLNFSEPVWTSSQLDAAHIKVKLVTTGTDSNDVGRSIVVPTSAAGVVTKENRATRWVVELAGKTIAPTAEVQVEISTAGAAKIVDAASKPLDPPLFKSTTPTVAAGSFAQPSATNLVVGSNAGGGTHDTTNQTQTFTAKVVGAIPASSKLSLEVPIAANYGYADPALTGFPDGTTVSRTSSTAAVYDFVLPSTAGIADGTTLSVTLMDVKTLGNASDSAETANGAGGALKLTRGDTGYTAEAKFDRLRGVFVKNLFFEGTQKQVLTLQLRNPTGAGQSPTLSVDLSDFVAKGVTYPTGNCTGCVYNADGTTPNNNVTAAWVGTPATRLQLVPANNTAWTANSDIVVSMPVQSVPAGTGGLIPDATLAIERNESPSAITRFRQQVVMSDVSWAGSQTQLVAFKLLRALPSPDDKLELTVTMADLAYTASATVTEGAGGVAVTPGTKKITYTPPAGGLPAGTVVRIAVTGIEAREVKRAPAPAPASVAVARLSNPAATNPSPSGTRPSFRVLGAPFDVLLTATPPAADFTDSAVGTATEQDKFGDEINDEIKLKFSTVLSETTPGEEIGARLDVTVASGQVASITCGGSVSCKLDTSDKTLLIMRTTNQLAAASQVTVLNKTIAAIKKSDGQPFVNGTPAKLVGVAPDYKTIT